MVVKREKQIGKGLSTNRGKTVVWWKKRGNLEMKLKLCEVVQEIDKINMDVVKAVIKRDCVRDYAYIIHDKDNTRSHIHIAIRFKDSTDTKYVAQWFGVGENFVNKVKGRWSDMVSYLTHLNAPEKFQYDDNEVVANFDIVAARIDKNARLNEILDGIDKGVIRNYNITDYVTVNEFNDYKRAMDNAFEYRMKKLKKESGREMECVYITGGTGTGKTTFAKIFCQNHNMSYCISGSSNDALQDYDGQDVLILDDLRDSSFTVSDLLKMLDNNTGSSVKSRYRNKWLECRMIIITSIKDIDEWYKGVQESDTEPIKQLKRRIGTKILMTQENVLYYVYDEENDKYIAGGKQPNPMSTKFIKMKNEEKLEKLESMFGEMTKVEEDAFLKLSTMDVDDMPWKQSNLEDLPINFKG